MKWHGYAGTAMTIFAVHCQHRPSYQCQHPYRGISSLDPGFFVWQHDMNDTLHHDLHLPRAASTLRLDWMERDDAPI